jgi:hypothetical protein|tara:strand:- start:1279 stop:1428 length:150 start_codon:yes stop_codon:yes gene_type:complete
MMAKKVKKRKIGIRNWFAVHAHNRTGAGNHGDKRKENSKKACRKYKWRG